MPLAIKNDFFFFLKIANINFICKINLSTNQVTLKLILKNNFLVYLVPFKFNYYS